MNQFYNIKYIDAYYSNNKEVGNTKLFLHEAWGYVKKNDNNIIISFIKTKYQNKKDEIKLGLVIPDTALISKNNNINKEIITNLNIGNSIAVTWRDIVFFDYNNPRNSCSIMYTEGILFKTEKDHVVIKSPETIRIYPNHIKNHPEKKPNYYVIPISFITDINKINE